MKVGFLLIAFLLPLSLLATSNPHGPNPMKRSVECQILDASSGEALTGVQVSIEGIAEDLWTDEEGKFTIDLTNHEISTLTCSLVSFETRSLAISDLEKGTIIYLREK